MPSALLLEDRLADAEQMMRTPPAEEDGVLLVIENGRLDEILRTKPPTIEEIRKYIGRPVVGSTPFKSLRGIYYWASSYHNALVPVVRIIYSEDEHLFTQEELGGIVVITRIDQWGRIRLLRHGDVEKVKNWIRITGYYAG